MPYPEQNLQHILDGLNNLIEEYRDAPTKFKGWVESYLKQAQDLENAIYQVIEERRLDTAVGVQLDILGKLVGLGREGLSDPQYRDAISVQIRINVSFGTPIDILTITRLVLGPDYPQIEFFEFQPASMVIELNEVLTADKRFTLLRALLSAKAAGVKLLVTEILSTTNGFTFNDAALTLGNNPMRGFGSDHGAVVPDPGLLSHIVDVSGPLQEVP